MDSARRPKIRGRVKYDQGRAVDDGAGCSSKRNHPLDKRAAFSRSTENAPATADASGIIPEATSRSTYERCPTWIPSVHGDASGLSPEESSRSTYIHGHPSLIFGRVNDVPLQSGIPRSKPVVHRCSIPSARPAVDPTNRRSSRFAQMTHRPTPAAAGPSRSRHRCRRTPSNGDRLSTKNAMSTKESVGEWLDAIFSSFARALIRNTVPPPPRPPDSRLGPIPASCSSCPLW